MECLGPIVLGCDEGFAMPMATTMRSIAEANRVHWPLDFHLLSDGLREETRAGISGSLPEGAATIRWLTVDLEAFENYRLHPSFTKMIFARLHIPKLFGAEVARVLYLDADLLVLEDIEPLWRTDMQGFAVAAVLDRWDHRLKQGDPELAAVPRVQNYFNTGVLLMDLARWRAERVSERAIAYLDEHPGASFPDQDALNAVCDGRWTQLDGRWNLHDLRDTDVARMAPERRPAIVHFAGRKPWKTDHLNLNAGFYDAYRSRTRYARTLQGKARAWPSLAWMRLKAAMRGNLLVRSLCKVAGRPKGFSAT